jgi:arsenate reductase (thioredoxin)
MEEVGIDISEQYPKGLKTYMGKMGFNYSIIVCARAEMNCPKTFPGVGTRLVWGFEDPRDEDVPEDKRLEKFRQIRDEIEFKIKNWLEQPEAELARLREERERERRERLEATRRAQELGIELGMVPEPRRRPHPRAPSEVQVASGSVV